MFLDDIKINSVLLGETELYYIYKTNINDFVYISKIDNNKVLKFNYRTNINVISEDGGETWKTFLREIPCIHCNGTGKVLV